MPTFAPTHFSCWLYLELIAKDGEATLSRHVWLPFVPAVGTDITFNEEAADCLKVKSVEYLVPGNVFWIRGTDEICDFCPCTPADECCTLTKHVIWNVENGWKLESERRGFDRMRKPKSWMFDQEKWFMTRPELVCDLPAARSQKYRDDEAGI